MVGYGGCGTIGRQGHTGATNTFVMKPGDDDAVPTSKLVDRASLIEKAHGNLPSHLEVWSFVHCTVLRSDLEMRDVSA